MPIQYYIYLCLALFSIGIVGVLTRRNAIIVFMCIELMLNAVNLLLVAFSKVHNTMALAGDKTSMIGIEAQLFVFFIMVVAAAEVSVGLAIIVMMYRNVHSVDINFLKDVDPALHDQYVFERYKAGATGRGSNTPEPVDFKFEKPVFVQKDFDLSKISELNTTHPARQFLDNRRIPSKYLGELYFAEKFKEWTNSQKYTFDNLDNDEPRIIIPLKNNGKIFGFQGRSLNPKSKLKYITIILDDHHPKIYGLDKVDWNKTVYIVEGPFDSMFIDNSIAMVGADIDKTFFITNFETNFVMVYDNEKRNKQIVDRMEKAIDWKFPIVIWPDTIQQKDINDMILSGLNVQSVIESNVYSGLQAKTKLTSWKKT